MAHIANPQPNHFDVHISMLKLWTKNLQCKSESSLTILWVFYKWKLLLQPMLKWNFTMKTCQIWCYVSHQNENLMERTMEQMWKEIYTTFTKHLLICDIALREDFLQEKYQHYETNLHPKLLTKKLKYWSQIMINNKEKFKWLKTWNEFQVVKKVPQVGFLWCNLWKVAT